MTTNQQGNGQRWGMPWIFQGLLLLVVWLLLSGHYDVMHISLGVASVGLVLFMNRKYYHETPAGPAGNARLRWGRFALYLPWLLWQMILSALQVARVVFSPRNSLQPVMVHFRSEQPNESASVILGNSITLTPGTLTLDIAGDEYAIHCLSARTEVGLLDGSMQRRVARLFVDQPGKMVFAVRRERSSE